MVCVLVFVMAQMLSLVTRLVPTIHSHRCPAELKRQQGQQDDGKPTTHQISLAATGFALVQQGCSNR